jgi:hypothetical protein
VDIVRGGERRHRLSDIALGRYCCFPTASNTHHSSQNQYGFFCTSETPVRGLINRDGGKSKSWKYTMTKFGPVKPHLCHRGEVFCFLLFEGTFTSFFKDKKSKKKSQNNRNQGCSYYFCLMLEGSGAGSIPLTNGSGSGSMMPKNVRVWPRGVRGGCLRMLAASVTILSTGGTAVAEGGGTNPRLCSSMARSSATYERYSHASIPGREGPNIHRYAT